MPTELRDIDDLPTQTASQVKNHWGDVVDQVREEGAVAITNHSKVEMVLLDARVYRELTSNISKVIKARNRASLDDLNARFEARLKTLQEPDVHRRIDALFEARGKFTGKRPIAGEAF